MLVMNFEGQVWRRKAACAGGPAGMFFSDRHDDQDAARKICLGCPVRHECLEYALALPEPFGIWGGTFERERRRIRTKRRELARSAGQGSTPPSCRSCHHSRAFHGLTDDATTIGVMCHAARCSTCTGWDPAVPSVRVAFG